MNPIRRQLCALLVSLSLPRGTHAATLPLTIGLFPDLSPRNLLARYLPLARYLEIQLQRPVQLYTAKNFRAFIEDSRRSDFDIVVTAPHLAWLAAEENSYQPMVQFSNRIRGIVIVAASSSLRTPQQLKGHDIAVPDPLALVTLLAEQRLKQAGLSRGRDYRFIGRGNHNNAMLAVAQGDFTAALVSLNNLTIFSPTLREKVRVIDATDTTPGIFFMAHPHLSSAHIQAIQTALLHFGDTLAGKQFVSQMQMGDIIPASSQELAKMAPYALQTMHMLRMEPR